ncbi:MAG TPA: hypothetical protein VG148_14640 [Pyrinomonadaceae bacterium]|nr:hypothetical protein [Pyrinomonadaceae bacterium]
MKHAFRLSRVGAVAGLALAALCGAFALAGAQSNVAATPDPFIVQLTNSTIPPVPPATPTPTPSPSPSPSPSPPAVVQRTAHASDIDGSGRFVVIESNGDISTERTPHVRNASGQIVTRGRNNEDGNQEIFLLDYAQRRIFQITDTTSALVNPALSPVAASNIAVEVVNLRPQLSRDGRYLVFISNAYVDGTGLTPKSFDGQANVAGLRQDANTEIFLYEVPQPPDRDLTSGDEAPHTDLAGGAIHRVTQTPASARPAAGSATALPFFARDNDAPAVSDDLDASDNDAVIIAFSSRARGGNVGTGNADGNSEIFVYEDTNLDAAGGTFVQATASADVPVAGQPIPRLVFNLNPSLSGDGRRLAFFSNADFAAGGTAEPAANQGNGEIYVANYNPGANDVQGLRRVTATPPHTRPEDLGVSVNFLSPGKRLSHNGNLLAFESFAVFSQAGAVSEVARRSGIYIYNIVSQTFTEVAARPPLDQAADLGLRWPTFTLDNSRIVFSSILNLRTDGTVLAPTDAAGLNPAVTTAAGVVRPAQIFSAPVSAPNQISRLTRMRVVGHALQPLPSDTVRRMAFSSPRELGGGNPPTNPAAVFEAFYLFIPRPDVAAPATPTPAAVAFATGASGRPVVAPSPQPSPSPAVTGLAPGMLGIARSALTLAPVTREVSRTDAHESRRRPPLPVELSGVSVSVDDAAAGLFFVAPNQINFVVPPGLAASADPRRVVIHNNGSLIRTTLRLNAAQPDIFTTTNGPGGRAAVLNVTNPCVTPPGEPFNETTPRPRGSASGNCSAPPPLEVVQTELLILLTGVRDVQRNQVTVRIGTTDISGEEFIRSVGPSQTPGFDQIVVRLPMSFNQSGDLPVIVTVNLGAAGTFSSRPADTAPRIQITATP